MRAKAGPPVRAKAGLPTRPELRIKLDLRIKAKLHR